MSLVIISFGPAVLALTDDEFQAAIERGRQFTAQHNGDQLEHATEKILDAEGASQATGIPSSWFLESARQNRIPHLRAGKYVRFKLSEVIRALEVRQR